jgi:flavin reductase (DIM6/NTAB) family NADH-FMN oxidoreductase RutF
VTATPRTPSFDSARFRQVLGHFPTGVTVITGLDEHGLPSGLTIGSFASVSLDPPLVGFFPGLSSTTWPAIASSGSFCVNVLAEDQDEFCWRFARETEGRFDGIDWDAAPSGSPILPGIVSWIDCSIELTLTHGDHSFVLGQVLDLWVADPAPNAMVFYRGKVTGVGPIG